MSDKKWEVFPEICQSHNSSTTFFIIGRGKKKLGKMSQQQLMTHLHFASTSDNTAAANRNIPRK